MTGTARPVTPCPEAGPAMTGLLAMPAAALQWPVTIRMAYSASVFFDVSVTDVRAATKYRKPLTELS